MWKGNSYFNLNRVWIDGTCTRGCRRRPRWHCVVIKKSPFRMINRVESYNVRLINRRGPLLKESEKYGRSGQTSSFVYSGGGLQGVTFNQVAQSAIELMVYVRAETCLRTISLSWCKIDALYTSSSRSSRNYAPHPLHHQHTVRGTPY